MQRRRDIPHSPERIKLKRRKTVWKFGGTLFLLIAVVSGIVWGLSRPAVRIAHIEVTGNSALSTDEITTFIRTELQGKYFFLFPKDNIALYPKEHIQADVLASFRRIASIEIRAQGLTSISVVITERKPYSLWCGDSLPVNSQSLNTDCYFMDSAGFLFASAPRFGENVYVEFYGPLYTLGTSGLPDATRVATSSPLRDQINPLGAFFLSGTEFKTINLFRNLLEQTGFQIKRVTALEAGDFSFTIREGGKIFLNKKEDPMRLVSDIESAVRAEMGDPRDLRIRKQIEYIDARFANKIFFKKKK